MTNLQEFRKGKPRPGDRWWYHGPYNKQGILEPEHRHIHPVEVMSFPLRDLQVFVRHTPEDALTARWVPLSSVSALCPE